MKPRYNLRIQSNKLQSITKNKKSPSIVSSRVTKKSKSRHSNNSINQQTRRHSLRLTTNINENKSKIHESITKSCPVENDHEDEQTSINNNDDDDYDDLLARHHRRMLEEQKDRKLYERYVRGQRTLRRLQCRRTHTAHLNEATRNRLLRELERERRYTIQDRICAYLSNHEITFQHGCNIQSKQPITWSNLEDDLPLNRNVGTIHELDVMIDNLKKVIQNSKASRSKPRLSVRERQNQRLTATKNVTTSTKSDPIQNNEIKQPIVISNSTVNISPSQLPLISLLPRVPVVRFIDDQFNKTSISNSQHLTCIQNVLLHHTNEKMKTNHQSRNSTNEISTSNSSRTLVLRPKSTHVNISDSSPTKKRPMEKENYSAGTSNHTQSSIVLRNALPMVSIKYSTSSASSRSYPKTRKHPMIHNSFATRRHTKLSTNV